MSPIQSNSVTSTTHLSDCEAFAFLLPNKVIPFGASSFQYPALVFISFYYLATLHAVPPCLHPIDCIITAFISVSNVPRGQDPPPTFVACLTLCDCKARPDLAPGPAR